MSPGVTWELVPGEVTTGAGWGCVGAVVGDALHLVVSDAAGRRSHHVRVESTGPIVDLGGMALRSVSGAAAAGDALVVGGARDTTPVVAVIDGDGRERQLPVQVSGRLAAWPIPVSMGATGGVVWAEAEPDGVVLARITGDGITVLDRVATGPVRALQAMSSDGRVDVLTYGDRARLLRWDDDDRTEAVPPHGSRGWLVPGGVAGPAPDGLLVWYPDRPAEPTSIALPVPRLGRIGSVWILGGRWVVWTVSESGADDGHGTASRTWVAPIDGGSWAIGDVTPSPIDAPAVVVELGRRPWLGGVDGGRLSVWRPVAPGAGGSAADPLRSSGHG